MTAGGEEISSLADFSNLGFRTSFFTLLSFSLSFSLFFLPSACLCCFFIVPNFCEQDLTQIKLWMLRWSKNIITLIVKNLHSHKNFNLT